MPDPGNDRANLSPEADEAAWLGLALRALEGRAFESLVSTTPEGQKIQPLYRRAMAESPRVSRQKPGAWKISQRIDHPDPGSANKMTRADLEAGADALTLCMAPAPVARGFGVAIDAETDLDILLQDIDLDRVPLRLDAGARALDIAHSLARMAQNRRLTSAALDVDFGLDPIGDFARGGTLATPPDDMGRVAVATAELLRDNGFRGHLLLADSRPYHEAGAGEAQELAMVLATGVTYLRSLESNGLALDAAREEIAFLLAADADEFLGLAKFRALRRLWARVESACGLTPKPIRLHAETAFRMMTARDPWTNIFRATMAVFSAGIGGADTITALPFTLALGLPDDFARRLARNMQLILIHEANLARVADPGAGSGAVETLTDQLCEGAWALFQKLDHQGGMFACLEAGLPQAEIAATAATRRAAIAECGLEITGTSAFPDLREAPVHVLEIVRALPVETISPALDHDDFGSNRSKVMNVIDSNSSERDAGGKPGSTFPHPALATCLPLPSRRDAEPFEILRDRADAIRARTGERPRIFLGVLGPAAAVLARAAWLENLFAAGGIETFTHSGIAGFATPQEAVAAFILSGCKIACLCVPLDHVHDFGSHRSKVMNVIDSKSSERDAGGKPGSTLPHPALGDESGISCAEALRAAGATRIYLAASAQDIDIRWRRAGVTDLVHPGCDVLALLQGALAHAV